MARKLAIILAIGMMMVMAWGLMLESDSVTIIINGQQVNGPMRGAIGIGGFLIAAIALFCAATLLAFVFAGFGLLILGFLVFFGVILAGFLYPFIWPLVIPLLIVWVYIALDQGRKS